MRGSSTRVGEERESIKGYRKGNMMVAEEAEKENVKGGGVDRETSRCKELHNATVYCIF